MLLGLSWQEAVAVLRCWGVSRAMTYTDSAYCLLPTTTHSCSPPAHPVPPHSCSPVLQGPCTQVLTRR